MHFCHINLRLSNLSGDMPEQDDQAAPHVNFTCGGRASVSLSEKHLRLPPISSILTIAKAVKNILVSSINHTTHERAVSAQIKPSSRIHSLQEFCLTSPKILISWQLQ